jgi:outer membrane protein assembly factor BamB
MVVVGIFAAALGAMLGGQDRLRAADWPQWRGPKQDGVSLETGLLTKWPGTGPTELWRFPLGAGYSSVSVAGGRAVTMYGTPAGEFVVALDAASGKPLWKVRSGDLFVNDSYGNGPRATPTINEGRVYALGGGGDLLCLEAATGKTVWTLDLVKKFGGRVPEYGFSASPAVFGKLLVVDVGAQKGRSLVAFDKATGEVLWTSLADKPGYATPIRAEVDGVPQIIVLMGEALVSVSPGDGREFWRRPWKTTLDANVATPIFHQGRLFLSTGYGTGCALFALSAPSGKPAATELWAGKQMQNCFSTSVLVDGYLYGFHNLILTCMDFNSGEIQWKQRGFNRGSLIAADGKLIIYGERATLALAAASPVKYKELARAQVLDGKTWTAPTLSSGRLFLRNEQEMVCLKLTP